MKYAILALLLFNQPSQVGIHVGNPDGTEPKAIVVHQHQAGGVDVVLWEVRRSGPDVVTAKWSYINTGRKAKKIGDSFYLRPYQALKTSETFTVPAGAKMMTIRIPGVEPFENVPITK